MLFPCPEGSVIGKSFQSEVLKAAFWEALSNLSVPAAAFDIEDHLSTGLRSKSCSGTNRLFFSGFGRNVWHWRSPQNRSKNEFLSSPGHVVSLFWRLRFGKPCLFYRFRPQRLTLKITPAQVSEVSPAAAQIVSFLVVPAATFDTEDHPSTGQKTSFLSSPGHAVSLFWRLRFGKPRWSEVEVRLKAKSRCEIRPEVSPEAAKIVSFLSVPAAAFDIEDHRSTGQKTGSWARQAWVLGSLDGQKSKCIWKPAATFDTEDHPSTGQKTSFLSSPGHVVSLFWRLRFGKLDARPCCFPVPKEALLGSLSIRSRGASQS